MQNQANTESSYQAELVNYITSHNMTVYGKSGFKINPNALNTSELEDLVKEHMKDCQSGVYDSMVGLEDMGKDWEIYKFKGHNFEQVS